MKIFSHTRENKPEYVTAANTRPKQDLTSPKRKLLQIGTPPKKKKKERKESLQAKNGAAQAL